MKNYLAHAAFAICCVILPATAQTTVLIDFNSVGTAPASNWNVLAQNIDRTTDVSLLSSTGDATGLSIGPFQGGDGTLGVGSSTIRSITPTGDASWVDANAADDYYFGGTTNTVGFFIQGLITGQEYTIDLFASNGADVSRVADYSLFRYTGATPSGNPAGADLTLESRFEGFESNDNSSVVMTWADITAGEDENAFFLSASGTSGSRFNAMRITVSAIPEPSAFAAVAGLGVLGLAASRRRRRD